MSLESKTRVGKRVALASVMVSGMLEIIIGLIAYSMRGFGQV